MRPDTRRTQSGTLKTVEEAARLLSLSPHTIRAWIASRELEYVRLGRAVRIPAQEIERLIRHGTVPARAAGGQSGGGTLS